MSTLPAGGAPVTYDRIGAGYRNVRHPDPRLAALIAQALAGAGTVLNVGAGTGSYEPVDAEVTAVDPSRVMLDQHPGSRKVRAWAEDLPFADGEFDAAMAIMTVHHWTDLRQGLRELRRVARRQVVLTWDPVHPLELWIVSEYLPEIRDLENSRFLPVSEVARELGAHTVLPFPIPHDFTDGFQVAFWRRPEQYLDATVRRASSTFATLPDEVVEPAVARLRADLESGAWARRHTDLLHQESVDYGFRLLIADNDGPPQG
ncbi:class I SAM-dependent methyltransferase [Streptomyces sp. CB03911]|uniref:class I SAM-dependent methyltransferase n=1 Tax=Streptomyces sp. CB03911 TaxID=1804758 RepID=UPI00093AB4F7|nr:class I SAM-dependent methyltransferase [Streptomyces sp. CB03911]OKI12855.1 MerR family transcriptional regulator [Streptomyces sp. CB03911]